MSVDLPRIKFPDSLSGKSVLDIGAWDGFYSFEAERRGAARVLATDSFSWGLGGDGTKAGFELARDALGSSVEDMTIDVLDLLPERVGKFDLVLFLGVLYHMRHPMLALERVFSVTNGLCILETHVDLLHVKRPIAAFYPGRELAEDPTNWWGPNIECVVRMLKVVGFSTVEMVSAPNSWLARLRWLLRHRRPVFPALFQDRAVFHAWV
jgi:tRNA (mo5U34)-methyltransferase